MEHVTVQKKFANHTFDVPVQHSRHLLFAVYNLIMYTALMKTNIIPRLSFKTWARRADYRSSSVEMFAYIVSLHIVVK